VGKSGQNSLGEEGARNLVGELSPVVTAEAGGPGAEGGNRIGIESFAGEHGDKQERRVVDAVKRGNIEFLAGERRGR